MKLEELLRHVADNVEAGKDAGDGLIFAGDPSRVTLARHIAWDEPDEYALAPKTRMINGFEVPAPETKAPKYRHKYKRIHLSTNTFHVIDEWEGNVDDTTALARGLVFLSAESATANAKAMLGIDPYAEADK